MFISLIFICFVLTQRKVEWDIFRFQPIVDWLVDNFLMFIITDFLIVCSCSSPPSVLSSLISQISLLYCTQTEDPALCSFLSHKRLFCFPPLCFLCCHPAPFLNTPVVHSLPLHRCIPHWLRPRQESLCQPAPWLWSQSSYINKLICFLTSVDVTSLLILRIIIRKFPQKSFII